jgi:hypothetical protein
MERWRISYDGPLVTRDGRSVRSSLVARADRWAWLGLAPQCAMDRSAQGYARARAHVRARARVSVRACVVVCVCVCVPGCACDGCDVRRPHLPRAVRSRHTASRLCRGTGARECGIRRPSPAGVQTVAAMQLRCDAMHTADTGRNDRSQGSGPIVRCRSHVLWASHAFHAAAAMRSS